MKLHFNNMSSKNVL